MSIIDDLMKPEAKPRILSGGPGRDGKWLVEVAYIDPELQQLVEGPVQFVYLSLSELHDWVKRVT